MTNTASATTTTTSTSPSSASPTGSTSPNISFLAHGRVSEVRDDGRTIEFKPTGTNYHVHLKTFDGNPYTGPVGTPVRGIIHISARKIYTVPSGGNFVAPIFGPPKIVQGRVLFSDDRMLIVRAGTSFEIQLPAGASAIDLNNGAIASGAIVNVVAFPGATFELKV